MSTPSSDGIVAALVADGLLEESQSPAARRTVERVLGDLPDTAAPGLPKLVEVVAYLGAALVLAAGFLFVAQQWDELGDTGRTLALLLVTVVLGAAGLGARGRGVDLGAARRRLAGTLLSGAAVVAGMTVAQAIDAQLDTGYRSVAWPALAGGVVATLLAVPGYRLARTAIGLLVMLGGAVTAVGSLAEAAGHHEALWLGGGFFVLAVVWLLVVEAGVFDELSVGRVLGAGLALFGAQVCLGDDARWLAYVLTLVVVVAGVLLYLALHDWPYLAVAVLGVTLLVPETVSDWAGDSLGTVGGVLVAGVTLLAASFAGYRLRAETTT